MIKEKIKEVMKERIRICDETQDNWDDGVEMCWNKFIDILTENIDETINYFLKDVTDEEFFWLAEIFDDIVEKTQCKKLIEVFKERLNKVNKNTYDQSKFENQFMRDYITYDEYIDSVICDIGYAEERIYD